MGCIVSCDINVFRDWISCGIGTLSIKTGLDSGTYVGILTDKFGNKYEISAVVDGSGSFDIDTDDLPEGLFNQFGGVVDLALYSGCDQIKIPISEGYDHVYVESIEIETKGGTMVKDTIGCV